MGLQGIHMDVWLQGFYLLQEKTVNVQVFQLCTYPVKYAGNPCESLDPCKLTVNVTGIYCLY